MGDNGSKSCAPLYLAELDAFVRKHGLGLYDGNEIADILLKAHNEGVLMGRKAGYDEGFADGEADLD